MKKYLMGFLLLVLLSVCSLPAEVRASSETPGGSGVQTPTETPDTGDVQTPTPTPEKDKPQKPKGYWKRAKSGAVYYYGENGKKVTGLTTIKGKKYYFTSKGVQRTGWRKIGSNYYFFKIGRKKNGCMVTSKKVNGISLKKSGKASQFGDALEKLKLMTKASSVVDEITSLSDSKTQKLRKCFNYVITFPYRTRRGFIAKKNWERDYAGDILFYHCGNCFSYASSFAYLANALGYQASAVSSGGHGWAEIGGRVYDPDWSLESKVDSYFNMSYDLSGINGRPNYKRFRTYVVKI